MANNYTQFSEVLSHLTADEEAWLRRQLEVVHVFGDHEYADGELPDGLKIADADWSGHRLWRGPDGFDPEDAERDAFQYEFCDDGRSGSGGRYVWFYVDETGDPEPVVHLVHRFLKQFRPHECWSLTYAWTCSSLRVSEFGGGAVFVTADGIEWEDADWFLKRHHQAFASRMTGNASDGAGHDQGHDETGND